MAIGEAGLPSLFTSTDKAVKETKPELQRRQLLTSISRHMKSLVSQGKKSFNRTKERAIIKTQRQTQKLLKDIKNNTKPTTKTGLIKFLLLVFTGLLIRSGKLLINGVKMFTKGVQLLGKTLRTWALSLFASFKKTKFGRWLRGVQISFLRFFKNMVRNWKLGGGVIGKITKGFRNFRISLEIYAHFFTRWVARIKGTVDSFVKGTKLALKGGGIMGFFGKFLSIGKGIVKIIGSIVNVFNPIKGYITIVKGVFNIVAKAVRAIFGFVGSIVKKVKTFFKPALHIGKLIGNFFGQFGKAFGVVTKIGGIVGKALKFIPGIGQVVMAVMTVVDGIMGFFRAGTFFDKKEGENVTVVERISAIIGSIFNGLTFGLLGGAKKWSHRIKGVFDFIVNIFTSPLESFGVITEWASRLVSSIWGGIKSFFSSSVDFVEDILVTTANWTSSLVSSIWGGIKTLFSGGLKVLSFYGEIYSTVFGWAGSLVSSIWDGIKSMFSSTDNGEGEGLLSNAMDAISGLGKKVISGLKGFVMKIVDGIGNVLSILKTGAGKVVSFIKGLFSDNETPEISKSKAKEKGAQIKEVKDVKQGGGIILGEDMSPLQRQEIMMNFMVNQFSDVLAKKIATATKGGNVDNIKTPEIRIV